MNGEVCVHVSDQFFYVGYAAAYHTHHAQTLYRECGEVFRQQLIVRDGYDYGSSIIEHVVLAGNERPPFRLATSKNPRPEEIFEALRGRSRKGRDGQSACPGRARPPVL